MPRLLLVDDNPSIHKIAETLLAPTDIQLVCADSAQEALNLVAQGERFDVALLDIVMAGMDGWQLLDQLRMHPATAGMPIAMMAGVLDAVDPARLEKASIQGFLKKPVELRDLGERVHTFLETRVEPPAPVASPFSTFPAVKLSDLPELRRPMAEESPREAPAASPEADLLLLTEADLWVEAPGTGTEDLSLFAEIPPEESLDLEDLDLDSLKGMVAEPRPAPVEEPAPLPALEPVEAAIAAPSPESLLEPAALPPPEPFPAPAVEPAPGLVWKDLAPEELSTQELPDLGPEAEPTFDPAALAGLDALSHEAFEPRSPMELSPSAFSFDPDFLAGLGESSVTPDVAVVGWSDESDELLGTLTPSQPLPPLEPDEELELDEMPPSAAPEPVKALPLPAPEEELAVSVPAAVAPLPVSAPVAHEAAPAAPEAAPAVPPATAASPAAVELLQAITADPALMDMLAKALVAKLGDQVLREIAWEVMPEVAERLQRH